VRSRPVPPGTAAIDSQRQPTTARRSCTSR
jgi:hypothetical protein